MKPIHLLFFIFIPIVITFYSCQKVPGADENHSPTADFTVTPETGDTSTVFTFDASASTDPEQGSDSLLYSWDFTGYHDWTEYTLEPEMLYKFNEAGTYEVGLQVKDREGWTDVKRRTLTVTN